MSGPIPPVSPEHSLEVRLIELALANGALRFGTFVTKSGRSSPYFVNFGAFCDGAALAALAALYAEKICDLQRRGLHFDLLFGPAYKGIPLAVAVAVALSTPTSPVGYAFNRKEAKNHGEGGFLVGAALKGRRVLILDDVITAGTAASEAIALIEGQGGIPVAIVDALDRMERGLEDDERSAVQQIYDRHHLHVFALADLEALLAYVHASDEQTLQAFAPQILAYRARYGETTEHRRARLERQAGWVIEQSMSNDTRR